MKKTDKWPSLNYTEQTPWEGCVALWKEHWAWFWRTYMCVHASFLTGCVTFSKLCTH